MEPSKKHKLRFSLTMNPCDPKQLKAAEILNTKGHGISEFVARAVLAYIKLDPAYEIPIDESSSKESAAVNEAKSKATEITPSQDSTQKPKETNGDFMVACMPEEFS